MAAFVGVHVCIHPQETLASATCRVGADRALEGRWKGGFSHACLYRCSKRACVRACVRVCVCVCVCAATPVAVAISGGSRSL